MRVLQPILPLVISLIVVASLCTLAISDGWLIWPPILVAVAAVICLNRPAAP